MKTTKSAKAESIAAIILGLVSVQSLQAVSVYDLTGGGSANIGGVLYTTTDQQSTGTGVIDPFVRLQITRTRTVDERGFNTSARPVLDTVNTSPSFTRDLQLGELPVVNINNVNYYEFLLDINQEANSPLLSFNGLQLYTRSTAFVDADFAGKTDQQIFETLYTGASLKYNQQDVIYLDASLSNGSGSGDLFTYIPTSMLPGSATDYVYLFSRFGTTAGYNANDGFEEWAIRSPKQASVPDGGFTAGLLGFGFLALGALRKKIA